MGRKCEGKRRGKRVVVEKMVREEKKEEESGRCSSSSASSGRCGSRDGCNERRGDDGYRDDGWEENKEKKRGRRGG